MYKIKLYTHIFYEMYIVLHSKKCRIPDVNSPLSCIESVDFTVYIKSDMKIRLEAT